MKLFLTVLIFTVAIFTFSAGTAFAQTRTADDAAIRKVISSVTDAFNKRDVDGLTRLYAADGIFINAKGERFDGKAIEKGVRDMYASTSQGATLKTTRVDIRMVAPDVAVVYIGGSLSGQLTAEGKRLADRQELNTAILRRSGSAWVIMSNNRVWSGGATC